MKNYCISEEESPEYFNIDESIEEIRSPFSQHVILSNPRCLVNMPIEEYINIDTLTRGMIDKPTGIIVCGIENSAPPEESFARVDTLLDLLFKLGDSEKLDLVKFLEFSGGDTSNQGYSEAIKLKEIFSMLLFQYYQSNDLAKYLVDQVAAYDSGSPSIIYTNNRALSTVENFSNTGELVENNDVEIIIPISGAHRPSAFRAGYWASHGVKDIGRDINVFPLSSREHLSRYVTDIGRRTREIEGIKGALKTSQRVEKAIFDFTLLPIGPKTLKIITSGRAKNSK